MTWIDCRDLEAEITKFEQVCADLANIKLDLDCKPKNQTKTEYFEEAETCGSAQAQNGFNGENFHDTGGVTGRDRSLK